MRATINWFQTASDCCAALLRAVAIGEPFEDDQSHTSRVGHLIRSEGAAHGKYVGAKGWKATPPFSLTRALCSRNSMRSAAPRWGCAVANNTLHSDGRLCASKVYLC